MKRKHNTVKILGRWLWHLFSRARSNLHSVWWAFPDIQELHQVADAASHGCFSRDALHPRRGRQRGSGERRPPSRSAFLALPERASQGNPVPLIWPPAFLSHGGNPVPLMKRKHNTVKILGRWLWHLFSRARSNLHSVWWAFPDLQELHQVADAASHECFSRGRAASKTR